MIDSFSEVVLRGGGFAIYSFQESYHTHIADAYSVKDFKIQDCYRSYSVHRSTASEMNELTHLSMSHCSSAVQVMTLEGLHTHQVGCGVGFTLFLVQATEEQLKRVPIWDVAAIDPLDVAIEDDDEAKGGAKRKAPAAAPAKAKKAK